MDHRGALLAAVLAATLAACAPNQAPEAVRTTAAGPAAGSVAAGPTTGPDRAVADATPDGSLTAPATAATASATTAAPTTAAPADAAPADAAPADAAPAASRTSVLTAPPASNRPVADATGIAPIPVGVQAAMTGVSWHPGCPVALADLRIVTVAYVDFSGAAHVGQLVVNASVADAVLTAFRELRRLDFPVARIRPVDAYGGSDDASVLADNTSAFNCRAVTGGGGWSRHAYGEAVDINPRENPYVYADGHVLDPAAAPFVNRSLRRPGMIDDPVVTVFAAIGWRWGGRFRPERDYQHFDVG